MEDQNNPIVENQEPKNQISEAPANVSENNEKSKEKAKKPIYKRPIFIIGAVFVTLLIIVSAIPSHEHVWGEWQTQKAATCAENGTKARSCNDCDEIQTEAIAAIEHSYGEWNTAKNATCTESGTKVRTCNNCGNNQTEVIGITEHSYGEWNTAQNATCTESGTKIRTCNYCDNSQTEVIAAIGHSYGEWVVLKESFCTQMGKKERVCVCGDVQTKDIYATGHSYGEWITIQEATCGQTGSQYAICSVCNDKKTKTISISLPHTYNEGTITKPSTCIAEGSKIITCTVCNTTQEEIIPALGHSVDNIGKCLRCGVMAFTMTSSEIEKSKKIKTLSHSVYEYSNRIEIHITLKDSNSYSVQVPMYVDVKIVDNNGNTLYSEILIKKASQSVVVIDYDEITPAVTNTGTLYYTVYNDYVSFNTISEELEEIPWTVTIELPNVPQTISYVGSSASSCKVTEITYKVSGDNVTFYFTGEKTYDKRGNNYSTSCYIGWKLYDEDGYVVDDGTCYTTSIRVGEKFKNASDTAYDVIEQGKTYRLVIMNVS